MRTLFQPLIIFPLLCLANLSNAQTFSLGLKEIQYSYGVFTAKNGDHFFCSTFLTGSTQNYYLTRIDSIGKVKWEKYIPSSDKNPNIRMYPTSDNGLIIFAKDYDLNGNNYSFISKLNESGNVEWTTRFQLKGNLLITPVSIRENSNKEYVLLYDAVEGKIFAYNRPQISVFSSSGELTSQQGVSSFVGSGNNYHSRGLYINDNGDYIINSEIVYVDLENNSGTQILKIYKENNKATLTSVNFGDYYDSDWPEAVIEKNGRIFIIGGYGVYSDYPYKYLSFYTNFGNQDIESKVILMDRDPLLIQQLVNTGKIPHRKYLYPNIDNKGNMFGIWFNQDHLTLNKWNAEGKICPTYLAPILNTASKIKTANITRRELSEHVDSISFISVYNLLSKDTTLIFQECNDIGLLATKKLIEINKTNVSGIFPNPTKNSIFINFEVTKNSIVTITLLSPDGKVLLSIKESMLSGKYQRKINTANFAKGLYIVQLVINNEVQSFKIIKE